MKLKRKCQALYYMLEVATTKGSLRVTENIEPYARPNEGNLANRQPDDEPLVTFVIPCYNSAGYMRKSIDSLLRAINHPCEVLIINDGSVDETSQIAHEYADKYSFVFAIDQDNMNWGGVVNTAIACARGTYFKVLDSDDYFDKDSLAVVLGTLTDLRNSGIAPDLFITNYVYDHIADDTKKPIQYKKLFPEGQVFTWKDMGRPNIDQQIMIHAAWFKTSVLRKAKVKLPTGASYMDSLLVLQPMPYVETLFYLDIDAYHYIIGREGQSVAIETVKKQIDQQLLASKLAIDNNDYSKLYEEEPNRALLMMGYISCMMSVSTIYLFKINTPEAIRKNQELWAYLEKENPTLYANVKKSLAGLANRRTRVGRALAKFFYWVAQRLFKFA